MYYAQPSWYIRTTAVKDALLRENEKTGWFPETIKWGRYGDWLNNNIDWAVSRSRYWGTPLPIWRCGEGHETCVGSLAELSELTGSDQSGLDPHRPFVDDVTFACPECGEEARRVPEVIDAWFDSGSMPFAQWGYPHVPGSVEKLRGGLPGRLHLRGHRPDPRLVLHADGDRHPGVRRVVLQERAVPGPHPGRGRPQDVQAPRQHPGADAADGPARRRRRALVHGRVGIAVGGPPGRARDDPGDRPQGAADLLEHRGLPGALRPHVRLVAGRPRARARRPPGAGPVGALGGAPAGRAASPRRSTCSTPSGPARCWRPTSTTCRTGTSAARAAASGPATPSALAHPARVPVRRDAADGTDHAVHHRAGLAGPVPVHLDRAALVGAPGHLAAGRRRPGRRRARRADVADPPAGRAGPGRARRGARSGSGSR